MKNLNIDPKGAASFAVLLLALINQVLAMNGQGLLPINSDDLNQWVSMGVTGVAALYGWYDKHHLTKSTSLPANSASKDASEGPKKGDNPCEDAK